MRKTISIIMIIAVTLCFSSCRSLKDTTVSDSDLVSENSIISSKETVTSSSEIVSETVSDDVLTEPSDDVSISSNASGSNQPPVVSVEQPVVSTQPTTPIVKTKPNFGKLTRYIYDLTKQVSFYSFDLTGTIVDYLVDEDLIYIVFTNSNIIKLYNSNTGEVVYSYSLPERPAEMHMFGNELWISFPELYGIYIYDKTNFEFLRKIGTRAKVFSFDKYNNYIFYVGEKQENYIYRYNMSTQELRLLLEICGEGTNAGDMFYEPAILVDENASTLYIAETNMTGCRLYSYNVETLEQRGVFEKTPDSGYSPGFYNLVRKIFLVDGYVYWNNYKLDPNVYWKAEQSYFDQFSGPGMLYADKDYVATLGGVYENASGKQILQFKPAPTSTPTPVFLEKKSKFAITKSKNIMYANSRTMYIFYG